MASPANKCVGICLLFLRDRYTYQPPAHPPIDDFLDQEMYLSRDNSELLALTQSHIPSVPQYNPPSIHR